jgi:hypothetical protein
MPIIAPCLLIGFFKFYGAYKELLIQKAALSFNPVV